MRSEAACCGVLRSDVSAAASERSAAAEYVASRDVTRCSEGRSEVV